MGQPCGAGGLDYLDIFVMFLQKAFKDLFFFNHLILKSFQNFNKPGIPDYGIIGDNWQVKISGGCSNKPVMQLGDVVDLKCGTSINK